ncbi:PD-(D/E)XK nuclease family protein [Porphyromonas sp. oral taxon 279 str. F0450]|uniref:PDDEXK-like family protein n=1 Tax=Porphyromonas sp. oral taxon 279 TaxID=712438 RepID=UPI00027C5CB0|nr:PD-(D/E)XK nuclease family protein [Porphyromonas sp. oral taxon 279]EJU15796.1 PD-(D/E)XK nuclease family protein [Porphyromonas sp. oral taxon 279 str. F0450]
MDTELDIQRFFREVARICALEQAQQEERNRKGENYNLFSILNIERYELKHSALIANLLDPKGSHGCGDAFLKAFFEIALKGTAYPFESSTPPQSHTEHYTGLIAGDTGGRIDILVESKSSHYGLIIENKIYAGDQDKQLTRYDNYGKKTFGADRYLLVYLTLFGSEASEGSTAKGNAKEVDYLCLSYAEDILRWLEQCVRLADNKPLVRESLNQYIRTIKQLTYQDMNQENIQEIIDLAVDHPEVVDILSSKRGAIAQGIREKYIFPKLEEYAKKKGCIFINKTDSNKLSEIRIQKDGWDGYIIISSESGKGPRWTNVWIGVKDNRPSEIKSPSQAQTDEGNGMKWKYLNPYNWESPENFPAMKTSVAEEIINKLDEIIEELGFK